MCLDPQEIVKKCIEYYTQLLDVQVCIDDNVKNNGIFCFNGGDEVEHIMSLLMIRGLGAMWDGLTNELFKKYVIKLRGAFTILF